MRQNALEVVRIPCVYPIGRKLVCECFVDYERILPMPAAMARRTARSNQVPSASI